MEKYKLLARIKELYDRGDNIINYLKSMEHSEKNSLEDILISYDFQAGSYIKYYEQSKELKNNYAATLAKVISQQGNFNSILEVGVGEATTLGLLYQQLAVKPDYVFGFDISLSRIQYARQFLNSILEKNRIQLVTGDLFTAPFLSDSVDIVYTSHSIEPNGGREEEALKELYRIARKRIILLEPGYEYANEEGKARMKRLGYVKGLYDKAIRLGYKVIEYRQFDISVNPANPTALIIIEKEPEQKKSHFLACPVTKTPLEFRKGSWYSKESMLVYPSIDEIPCLLPQNAIVATYFNNF